MFLNKAKCENEIMEETQENGGLQIKESKNPKNIQKKKIQNYCKFPKGKNEVLMIEMSYVCHSFV